MPGLLSLLRRPDNFFRGLWAPLRGWDYLSRTGRRGSMLVVPAVGGGIFALLFLAGFILLARGLSLRVGFDPGVIGTVLKILFYVALTAGTLALTAASTLLAMSLLTPLWHGKVLEKIERELGVGSDELKSVSLLAEASDSLTTLATLGGLNLIVFVVGWFPVLGSALSVFLGWYWNSFYLGLECLDYPLALRGRRRREKVAFAESHRAFTMGLGTFLLAVGWIPGLGTALYACGSVGSALEYRRLIREGSGAGDSKLIPPS